MDRTKINTWMDRAAAGDAAAFSELSGAVQDELFRLGLSLGLSREDAIEVTQESLMRAYAARKKWKCGNDALGWFCGIVVNVTRECRRRERRNTTWLKDNVHELAALSTAAAGPEPLDADQLQLLAHALAELPPRQNEAIACRFLRRMSIRETAQAMNCAEGTVKSAVNAALEQLHAALVKVYPFP